MIVSDLSTTGTARAAMWLEGGLDGGRVFALIVLIVFALLYLWSVRSQQKTAATFPSMHGLEQAKRLVDRAAESGGWLHFSAGTAPIGAASTAETLAGLSALRELLRRALARRVRVRLTTADPITHIAAAGLIESEQSMAGHKEAIAQAEFIAPEPIAYAAGVMGLLDSAHPTGNLMLGSLGDEYLLMGHVGAERGITQIVGSSVATSLPFVVTSADSSLLGEEIFTAGPHLGGSPAQLASLVARDRARLAIIAVVLGLALLRTLGVL